eukprot:2610523-Alexandrium_andersonii.AAC.1
MSAAARWFQSVRTGHVRGLGAYADWARMRLGRVAGRICAADWRLNSEVRVHWHLQHDRIDPGC